MIQVEDDAFSSSWFDEEEIANWHAELEEWQHFNRAHYFINLSYNVILFDFFQQDIVFWLIITIGVNILWFIRKMQKIPWTDWKINETAFQEGSGNDK